MEDRLKQDLLDTAMAMGAMDARLFSIQDIRFDPRTQLKCLFGCTADMHYCPIAQDPAMAARFPEIMKRYSWGVLICTDNLKDGQDITLALERQAFLAGQVLAFGATECAHCANCSYPAGKPCVDKHKQRPPLYALGIDVYATARGLGWELEVVQAEGDPRKNITAVFVA